MQRVESRPAPPSQGLQGCGSEASEAHEGEAPEMQSQGSHRSLYDRAFGGGFGDMHHAHMPSPWQQHSDLIGDRECEEMLYRRQMAMAAQDRARYASSYNSQMAGKTHHSAPQDYGMRLMNGSHQQAMMAHAAASRRSMHEMAHAQAEMAHSRGIPFDMPYPAANRRMMYSPYYGADGCSGSPNINSMNEQELAHYGMCTTPCGPSWKGGIPAQSIDIDVDIGGKRGKGGGVRQCDALKQDFSDVKKELVIFPRRKAGQSKRQSDNEAPVKLTPDILEEIASIPLVAAAQKLGISKTALKNACRNLGLKRWPFRRRREDARRSALVHPMSAGDSPSTAGKDSPSNSTSTDGNHKYSPPHDSMDEDDDSDSSGDEASLNTARTRNEQAPQHSDLPRREGGKDSHCASGKRDRDAEKGQVQEKGRCGDGDAKRLKTEEAADIACMKRREANEGGKFAETVVRVKVSEEPTIIQQERGGGARTPPERRQGLSRAGSQDEDDLFNVGCNHSASEMWMSLGERESRSEYHLHVHDTSRRQVCVCLVCGDVARGRVVASVMCMCTILGAVRRLSMNVCVLIV